MAFNIIPLLIMGVGCICIMYFAYNNIKEIRSRTLPQREQRRLNRIKKAKKKYGKCYNKK